MGIGIFCVLCMLCYIVMNLRYPSNFLFMGRAGEVLFAALPVVAILSSVIVWRHLEADVWPWVSWPVATAMVLGALCSFRWEVRINYAKMISGKLSGQPLDVNAVYPNGILPFLKVSREDDNTISSLKDGSNVDEKED